MKTSAIVRFAVFVMAVLAAFSDISEAQTETWGGSNGNWTVPANWTSGTVPGLDTNALIDSGTAMFPASYYDLVPTITVGNSGTGALAIDGTLQTGTTILGNTVGSSGSVSVNSGATWSATQDGSIIVGEAGAGSLVLNGGTMNTFVYPTATVTVGDASTGSGTIAIDSGSWNSDQMYFGNSGTGTLLINGGYLTSFGEFGIHSGGVGSFTATSGSWVAYGNLYIGESGSGSGLINGGMVSMETGQTILGMNAGGYGSLTIDSGSFEGNPGGMTATIVTVGQSGTGVLNINGGYFDAGAGLVVGGSAGSTGSVAMAGGTFALPQLTVGGSGTGAMVINGGYVSANTTTLGLNAGSSGAVTIGSGTLSTTSLVVGESGTASLLVNGGYVTSSFGAVGDGNTYATATVTGGTWATTGLDLGIGNSQATSGTGVLNVNGGIVTTGSNAFIGTSPYGAGMLTVTSGSLLVSSGSLHVYGYDGPSSLTVNGGYVSDPSADSQASGTVNVSSGTWATTGQLYLNSTMFNFSGGLVSDGSATVQSSGTLSGGSWTNSGVFQVDQFGNTSTFAMTGGALTSVYSQVGQGNYATATITGGTWTSGSMTVGGIDGVLNLSGSGVVNIGNGSGTLALAVNPTDVGTLNIGTGGAAGTLLAAGVSGGSGTATVNFNSTGTNTFTPLISGNITVNQTGSGDTVLTGSNTYTGTTTVSTGTLTVNGANTNSPAVVNGGVLNGSGTTGNVTVNSGGVLRGTLTSGTVTVNSGGTVSPGNSPGADSAKSMTLNGGATYAAQILVPGGGNWTGAHPVGGTDYNQTTLTGTANGETVLTLGTGSILQLTVTGNLPAGGIASPGNPYNPSGPNSTLDNYFILNLGNTTDLTSGSFTMVTTNGVNFTNIDYSAGNLVGGVDGDGSFFLDGEDWIISYTGNPTTNSTTGGDDVVLTAAEPVPAMPQPWMAMAAIGATGMIALARRTKRQIP